MNGDGELKTAALATGAKAYLLKPNAGRELLPTRLRWTDNKVNILSLTSSASYEESTWNELFAAFRALQVLGSTRLERERHQEPVAGWHACVVACAELN